jgi:hypothetical protein
MLIHMKNHLLGLIAAGLIFFGLGSVPGALAQSGD